MAMFVSEGWISQLGDDLTVIALFCFVLFSYVNGMVNVLAFHFV